MKKWNFPEERLISLRALFAQVAGAIGLEPSEAQLLEQPIFDIARNLGISVDHVMVHAADGGIRVVVPLTRTQEPDGPGDDIGPIEELVSIDEFLADPAVPRTRFRAARFDTYGERAARKLSFEFNPPAGDIKEGF